VLNEIKGNWLTGLGNIRSYTKEDTIGDVYFHVSDIGLFGILFVSGIIGLLVYSLQVFIGVKQKKYIDRDSNLSESFYFLLLYLLLFTLGTGVLYTNPNEFLLLIIIIQALQINDKKSSYTNYTGQL